MITADEDNFQKLYTNQVGDIEVTFKNDLTTEVSIIKEGQDLQTFRSTYAVNNLGAAGKYNGKMFKFKHASEHTIDGLRMDLEMQVVHVAESVKHGVTHAAIGIFFSVDEYSAILTSDQKIIIDDFFDSLQWGEQNDPVVPNVPFGDLM